MLSVDASQVLIAYTIEFDNTSEVAVRGLAPHRFLVSRAFWTNLVRLVPDEGASVGQLCAGASGSPVKSMLGGLERWGYVTAGDGGRSRPGFGSSRGLTDALFVRLTPFGSRAREIWMQTDDEVAKRWNARFGAATIDALTGALRALLEAVGAPTLPGAPPLVAPSDGFRTDPACAQATDDAGASLPTLLARMVVAFTLEFERDSPVSLPLAANFLAVLVDAHVPVRELPARSNVSREAVRMALGNLERQRLAGSEPAATGRGKAVALTDAGRAAHDAASDRRAQIERDWQSRGGDACVGAQAGLDAILDAPALVEALTPPPGGWRLTKPYDVQTRARLESPREALPGQPMALHRGGWPDGA